MNRRLNFCLALAGLLFSCLVFAEAESVSGEVMEKCKYPPKPQIPNGRTATEDEMLSAQRSLKSFLTQAEEYIGCLDGLEQGWGETITDEQKSVVVIFHNRAVDEMNSTADLFNQAVRAFKGKKGE